MRNLRSGIIALAAILTGSITFAGTDIPPAGATSCTGCHSAQMLSLDDMTAEDIEQALAEFRSGAREATLMNRIAAGFTDQESAAIAVWLNER